MENIDKLIKLKKENPELEIIPFVWYEVVGDDSYGEWKGEIGDVIKTVMWETEDRYFLGEDDIQEKMGELIAEDMTETEFKEKKHLIDKMAEEQCKKEAKEIICISIGA